MFRNGIPRICIYFDSTERNFQLSSLPGNGSERNSESLHLFWFHGTEFRVVFSSVKWFGTESCEFASIFVPRNGIPSYFLFRGRARNGIPRFSVPRNNRNSVGNDHLFRLFRLPRNYFFVGNSQPYACPRKDPFHMYSLSPHSLQFQQSAGATPYNLSGENSVVDGGGF